MTKIVPFTFEEHEVRTVTDERGNPWFVARDVCEILEISNTRDAITKLRDKDKGVGLTDTPGGKQEMTIISEFGLYELVLSSRKENAKKFKYWICDEVIPSIRKTGSYSIKPKNVFDMMREQINMIEDLDDRTKRQETKVKALEMSLAKRDGYFSVAGYLASIGESCDARTAAIHGKKLTKICKEMGIEIPTYPHPAWGRVNLYPEFLLEDYFRPGDMALGA